MGAFAHQEINVAKVTKTFQYGNHEVTLETGEIARQAGGAVMVSMGGTVVLVTAVAATKAREGQDFFPLTVDYQEKFYSGRPHPRRLLQARRPPDREGNADLAPDRSPGAPAVPGGIQERSAGHRHRASR